VVRDAADLGRQHLPFAIPLSLEKGVLTEEDDVRCRYAGVRFVGDVESSAGSVDLLADRSVLAP